MEENYLVNFLEAQNAPVIKKKKHMYLAYHGLEESYTYVLKEGVVKTSIILKDGREFNLAYITPIDIISLLRDEVSNYTSAPFNVRVESEEASFYRIQRIKFWEYVKEDRKLQDYIREYYRQKLSENIESLQYMKMNGKKGAVCAFIYKLVKNYMIDVLWYVSFCLILFEVEVERKKYAIAFLIGMLSESLQFFIHTLGTFDVIDLLLYGVVLLIFYIAECKKLLI